MAKMERVREEVLAPPAPDYWKRKTDAGWRLAAVEWIREASAETASSETREEIPYGLKIADDCVHLEAHPVERESLMLMLELIVQDRTLSEVAAELNDRGFRNRRGGEWGPAAVFNLLPRMIELGPHVFSQDDWAARRRLEGRPGPPPMAAAPARLSVSVRRGRQPRVASAPALLRSVRQP